MKKRKITVILISSLIFLFVLSIATVATLEYVAPKLKTNDAEAGDFYINNNSAQTVVYNENGAEKELTFKETYKVSDSEEMDIYVDENNTEYRYDDAGNLVGTYAQESSEAIASEESITEAQAIAIATADAQQKYSEQFPRFIFESANVQSWGVTHVFYYVYYGEDDFVEGESLTYCIYDSGEIAFSSIVGLDDLKDFDETLLNGYTRETVVAEVDRQLLEKYGTSLVSYDVTRIRLVYEDGKYCLLCIIDVETTNKFKDTIYIALE